MRISEQQVEAACSVAEQVHDGQIRISEGVEKLAGEYGINPASARDFIYDYRCLAEGRVFHRAMSAPAMRHFVSRIVEKRGPEGASNALAALRSHIEYYEQHYKVTMHALRSVADEFERTMIGGEPMPLAVEYERRFQNEVERSLLDDNESRRERLAVAARKPRTTFVRGLVFVRNPDVVAEVLLRANGYCERCAKPAPFLRAKDATPYLEVHHQIRLADGGEDTVENAIALCPNCHRELHFGHGPELRTS